MLVAHLYLMLLASSANAVCPSLGIDLGSTLVTAAYLDNGNIIPAASIRGSDAYIAFMKESTHLGDTGRVFESVFASGKWFLKDQQHRTTAIEKPIFDRRGTRWLLDEAIIAARDNITLPAHFSCPRLVIGGISRPAYFNASVLQALQGALEDIQGPRYFYRPHPQHAAAAIYPFVRGSCPEAALQRSQNGQNKPFEYAHVIEREIDRWRIASIEMGGSEFYVDTYPKVAVDGDSTLQEALQMFLPEFRPKLHTYIKNASLEVVELVILTGEVTVEDVRQVREALQHVQPGLEKMLHSPTHGYVFVNAIGVACKALDDHRREAAQKEGRMTYGDLVFDYNDPVHVEL